MFAEVADGGTFFMQKRKVIIDTDPGIDDSLAIMMALESPEIEVCAITIVCGNCPADMGLENAKKILKHMGRLDIPVYVGQSKPIRREYVNALDTHGSDGLGESFLDEVEGYEQEKDAVSFMSEFFKKEKCSVIAIGPLTNLAALAAKDYAAFCAIDEIVSMGGCFKSYGNCSPVAEYNYWCDPDGAKMVYDAAFKSGRMIHMVGLDVTRKIVLTPTRLEFIRRCDPLNGDFIKKITGSYYDFHWEYEHIIGCVINDPLAVAYFIDRDICDGFCAFTDIETGGISIGQSVTDEMDFYHKNANSKVLTGVNIEKFWDMFYERIIKNGTYETKNQCR